MKAGVFLKRVAAFAAVSFCLFSFSYAAFINGAVKIGAQKNFYYLTTNAESVEVGVLDVTKNGGAGYVLDENGGEIALAVYFNSMDAENVFASNLSNYRRLKVCLRKGNALYVKKRSDKKRAKKIKADFEAARRHIAMLDEILVGLENGETQEAVKRNLGAMRESFQTLEVSSIEELRPLFACGRQGVSELGSGIVTASELRYLLCELSVLYTRASGAFAL